jgi:four helix bundle protein
LYPRSSAKQEGGLIKSHEELDAYELAFGAAMRIFALSKRFPKEETYSLTDQVRRSSRSVCSNITEAWRKRRYEAAFVCKLNDAESEAAETQTWLRFAGECACLSPEIAQELYEIYDHVIGKLVNMINNPKPWLLVGRKNVG